MGDNNQKYLPPPLVVDRANASSTGRGVKIAEMRHQQGGVNDKGGTTYDLNTTECLADDNDVLIP